MVTRIFQLLLLLSPIVVGMGDMDSFDLIFFRTGIIALFAVSLIDKPKRTMPEYVNRIIIGLLGICIFNLFIHTFAQPILANTMNLFLAVIGFYTVYTYLDENKNLIKFILWAGAINLIFCIGQRLGFDPVFEKIPHNRVALAGAFLGNNPRLGNYFTLLIPFLPLVWMPLGLGLFLLTKQAVVLIPVALTILARLKNLKLRIGFILILILTFVLLKKHIIISLNTRLVWWVPAIEKFFDQPFIGYGLGIRIFNNIDAYFNSYLSFIIGTGILGLGWFGYVLKIVYKKLNRGKESIALMTLALLMIIEYPIEHTRLWYLIIGIIVLFLIKQKESRLCLQI